MLLKDCIRKRFANRRLGARMVGVLAVNTAKRFLKDKDMTGYVKFHILYLKTTRQQTKIEGFKLKKELIEHISTTLQKLGYTTTVTDVQRK